MEIRPHRIIKRKITKKIKVGTLSVGGDSIISVQSMTNTLTTDIKGTINQIQGFRRSRSRYSQSFLPRPRVNKSIKRNCKESFSSYCSRYSFSL